METTFVVGDYGGMGPCVLKLETAQSLAARGDDLTHASTFRDYLNRCRQRPEEYDAEWLDELAESLDELGTSLNDPFTIEAMPGYGDGWFPADPRTAMLDDLPEEVLQSDAGRLHDVMGGGLPKLYLEERDLIQIRALLERLGHAVHDDQAIFDRMA